MEYKSAGAKEMIKFIEWCDSCENHDSLICDLFFALIEHNAKHSIKDGTLKNIIFEGLENFDANWFSGFILVSNFSIECEHVIDTWFDRYIESKV